MTNQDLCYVVRSQRTIAIRIFKVPEDGSDMLYTQPFVRDITGVWRPASTDTVSYWRRPDCDTILKDATFAEALAFLACLLTEEGDTQQANWWLSLL